MRTLVLLLLLAAPLWAEDWTVNGRDYHNVKVGQVDPDRVHITYDGGLGTVMLSDLTPELQKRFNYDPAQAKATTRQRDADQKAAMQSYTSVDAERKNLQAQEAQDLKAQELAKSRVRIVGTVLQKCPGGYLVNCKGGYSMPMSTGDSMASMGGGGGVFFVPRPAPVKNNRPPGLPAGTSRGRPQDLRRAGEFSAIRIMLEGRNGRLGPDQAGDWIAHKTVRAGGSTAFCFLSRCSAGPSRLSSPAS